MPPTIADPMPQKRPLKLLIVGGGIAGLTLAIALEKAPINIEFLLFEAGDILSPQVGASIGVAPNGCRILDQLGVYDDLEKLLEPVTSEGLHDQSGKCLTGERTNLFPLISKRMAYPVAFLERRNLLKLLAQHVRRRNCVLTGKKVKSVQENTDGAVVVCTDGTSYRGDIVVGADGVHSRTRKEMWRAAEERGQFDVRAERQRLTAEYKCLYAISKPVPGLAPGSYDVTQSQDISTLVITGQGGKVYWFLFGRMAQVYTAQDIPRFLPEQAEQFVREHRELPIRPHGSITLGQLWEAREQTTLTSLEEADFQHWTSGRIVCLGDSAHKMTPNSGAGGMLAIESAAALANAVYRLARMPASASSPPSLSPSLPPSDTDTDINIDQIEATLRAFQGSMHARASATIKSAAEVTRLQALRGIKEQLLTRYILPHAGDFTVNAACESWVGAGRVDYLPVPPRSVVGNAPFNPTQGIGRQENWWTRAAIALPLLAVGLAAAFSVSISIKHPVEPLYNVSLDHHPGHIEYEYHTAAANYSPAQGDGLGQLYRMSLLEDYFPAIVLPWLGRESHCWLHSLLHFTELGIWYAIMLVESARRANQFTILRFALLWGMLSLQGISIFVPVYYVVHYILTPISAFKAADMRTTDTAYTVTVLPIIILIHFAASVDTQLSTTTLSYSQVAGSLWKTFPVLIGIIQTALTRYILPPSTIQSDRLHNVRGDLPTIRRTILLLCAISAALWQYTIWLDKKPVAGIYLPGHVPKDGSFSFEAAFTDVTGADHLFFHVANVIWIALLAWDLKAAGMVQRSWFTLTLFAAGLAIAGGNGTLLGVAWLYREEILATEKHKHALVKVDSVAGE